MSGRLIWAMAAAGFVAVLLATLVVSGFTGLDNRAATEVVTGPIAILFVAIWWRRECRDTNRRIDREMKQR